MPTMDLDTKQIAVVKEVQVQVPVTPPNSASLINTQQPFTGAVSRTQADKNADSVSVKDFGAIGDGTLHTVAEWHTVGSTYYKGFADLAAVQVKYPHVTSSSDSIDWAAIQQAISTKKNVVGAYATYVINKSLWLPNARQEIKSLGVVKMDAALGKPCIYIGAKDESGTKTDNSTWYGKLEGIAFIGSGARAVGSAGVCLVASSNWSVNFEARGFHAGLSVKGISIVTTLMHPLLIQNTYGVYDATGNPTIADIQGSIFIGGRIEQNQKEGVYTASPNIKFIGTVIEGNGKWDSGVGDTAEVKILAGTSSGAVTFTSCYMESLTGKSVDSIIEIAPNASRMVFINGGEYFGSLDNNKYVVKIKPTASVEMGVQISSAFVADAINYVSGVVSGNSRVSVINCFPKVDMALSTSVSVGVGGPLIQQIDRSYHRTNQNVKALSFQSDSSVGASSVNCSGTSTSDYFVATNAVLGLTLFAGNKTERRRTMASAASSYTCIPISDIGESAIYIFNIVGIQRLSSASGRGFSATLLVAGNSGEPLILDTQINYNTAPATAPSFTSDATGVIVGALNAAATYDFYITKQGRS